MKFLFHISLWAVQWRVTIIMCFICRFHLNKIENQERNSIIMAPDPLYRPELQGTYLK